MEHGTHHNNHKSNQLWQWLILVAAVAVLLTVVYFTARSFFTLQRSGYIRPARHNHLALFAHGSNQLSVTELRSWMTFNYINREFSLPADYLKTALKITSNSYPKLSITSLAAQQKKDPAVVLTDVENAIKNYTAKPTAGK